MKGTHLSSTPQNFAVRSTFALKLINYNRSSTKFLVLSEDQRDVYCSEKLHVVNDKPFF